MFNLIRQVGALFFVDISDFDVHLSSLSSRSYVLAVRFCICSPNRTIGTSMMVLVVHLHLQFFLPYAILNSCFLQASLVTVRDVGARAGEGREQHVFGVDVAFLLLAIRVCEGL